MRARKTIKWFAIIVFALLICVSGTLYIQICRVPGQYHPARLTAEQRDRAVKLFWKKFLEEFNDGAQSGAPYVWSISEGQLNRWLGAADEIAASRPSGEAGEVYRAMERAGFTDPAVSLGDGILTVMVRSKEYDKVLSADVSFSFTADRKLRVRLEEARVGRLALPNAWVESRVGQLKRFGPGAEETNQLGERSGSGGERAGLSPQDVGAVLKTVLAAIDEEPIETELTWPVNRRRLRIVRVEIGDDMLRLHVVPLPRTTPRR